jgi:drug/metabolite transporter (DMT)-like permease
MTRLALQAFDPITIAIVRGTGAGLAALVCLALSRDTLPTRDQIVRMFYAGLGIVTFFPLLISIGRQFVPATHAGVVQSILPLTTAFFGVVRGREKASRGFWISAILGAVLVAAFCQFRSNVGSIGIADILVVLSFVSCAYGYAEGALVTRELGGWKTICWILVIMLPLNLLGFFIYSLPHGLWRVPPSGEAWTGLTYLTLVSQFLAFYFFYRGLALGGVAKMCQLQLLSPFLSIYAAHLVLGEVVDATVIVGAMLITAIVVAGCLSLRRP